MSIKVYLYKKNDPSGFWRFMAVFMSSNNNCSAQNRPREPSLVSLEPSRNEDSKYLSNFSRMSVNETVSQNVWQHYFPGPCGGGGRCGTNWFTELVEIGVLYEFDENYRFFTISNDPYMDHTFRLFLHISL
jgi:hypothetical protein